MPWFMNGSILSASVITLILKIKMNVIQGEVIVWLIYGRQGVVVEGGCSGHSLLQGPLLRSLSLAIHINDLDVNLDGSVGW